MAPSYRVGKGPIVEALERCLDDAARRETLRTQLETALRELAGENGLDQELDFENVLGAIDRDHLRDDILGGDGGPERRLVYYEGMKRALDLARSLRSTPPLVPIQVFWGCGQGANECWVTWSSDGGGPVITVLILSDVPAVGSSGHRGAEVPAGPDGVFVVRGVEGVALLYTAEPAEGEASA